MATNTQPATSISIVKDPTTPKESAIIDAVRENPDASHSTIADRVEDMIGERPSNSWVSRVRSSFVLEDEAAEYDTSKIDDLVTRLERIEDVVDEAAQADDVDRAITAVEALTDSVDALADDVREVKQTVDLVCDMVSRDIHDDVIESVLRRELDRIEADDVSVALE